MRMHELQYDKNDARYFRTRIDWCQFGAVLQSVDALRIEQAFLVDLSVDLDKVAAIAWSGDATEWKELMVAGIVQHYCERVPSSAHCRVIHIPPVCLVQLTGLGSPMSDV